MTVALSAVVGVHPRHERVDVEPFVLTRAVDPVRVPPRLGRVAAVGHDDDQRELANEGDDVRLGRPVLPGVADSVEEIQHGVARAGVLLVAIGQQNAHVGVVDVDPSGSRHSGVGAPRGRGRPEHQEQHRCCDGPNPHHEVSFARVSPSPRYRTRRLRSRRWERTPLRCRDPSRALRACPPRSP
jgi:hypothetical protein